MKKNDFIYKTIQLILFVLLTIICLSIVLLDSRMFHLVATDGSVRILCALLWIILGISFVFIYRDFNYFSSYKKDYHELDYAVHSDPLSGLANHFSCDVMVNKYVNRKLPEDIACIMFELTNLADINQTYGHVQGNLLIKEFANILKNASINVCFIGRNGGNKFLAIFEKGTQDIINQYLEKILLNVQTFNNKAKNNLLIEYKYGLAFHEENEMLTITDLISLSNSRIYQ